MERAVALNRAAVVVVNRLARTREQARRGIVLVHDEVGVGFVALERDAHHHLADGRAGQRVGAAERLRAEQHVNAERATLAHNAVEQQRRALRDAIVLHEQLLKLVNQQQHARHRLLAAGALVAGDVLRAEFAEQIAAALEFVVHALQHAQAELAVALDGDDPRVRQFVRGVALELDALLEVHEVKLHLLRAAPEREVGDDDVKQRGLAGTGLARDQAVLPRALTEREVLQLRRARAADRHAQFARRLQRPHLIVVRRDFGERHFDAIRIGAVLADLLEQLRGEFRVGRRVEREFDAVPVRVGQREAIALGHDADGVLAQFLRHKFHRRGLALIPMDEQMHAATRAAGGDALQALHRHLAEVRREIRDDEEMIFLRQPPGLRVVFRERFVFVAQIHLRDLLDVFVEIGEALLELRLLRPDAAVDEALLEIRQVHDAGEVLSEANRIEDRESQPARRRAGEQAQHEIVQRADDLLLPRLLGLKQARDACRGTDSSSGTVNCSVRPAARGLCLGSDTSQNFSRSTASEREPGGVGECIRQREIAARIPRATAGTSRSACRRGAAATPRTWAARRRCHSSSMRLATGVAGGGEPGEALGEAGFESASRAAWFVPAAAPLCSACFSVMALSHSRVCVPRSRG